MPGRQNVLWCWRSFLSIPVYLNRNVTMALNNVNYSFWFKVPFLLSTQSFDFSRVSFSSGFQLGRLFQVAKVIMTQFQFFVYRNMLCLYHVLFLQLTVSPTISVSAWSLLRLPDGSLFLWSLDFVGATARGIWVPLMVMRFYFNSSISRKRRWPWRIRIRWCRNIGIQSGWIWLVLLMLALMYHREACIDMSQRDMWLLICRQNWRGERSKRCSQKGYPCRRIKWCCLWCG